VYPYFFVCGGGGMASFELLEAKGKGFVLLKQLQGKDEAVWWLFVGVVVSCGGVWLLTALWFVVVAVCCLLFGQLVCSWLVIL